MREVFRTWILLISSSIAMGSTTTLGTAATDDDNMPPGELEICACSCAEKVPICSDKPAEKCEMLCSYLCMRGNHTLDERGYCVNGTFCSCIASDKVEKVCAYNIERHEFKTFHNMRNLQCYNLCNNYVMEYQMDGSCEEFNPHYVKQMEEDKNKLPFYEQRGQRQKQQDDFDDAPDGEDPNKVTDEGGFYNPDGVGGKYCPPEQQQSSRVKADQTSIKRYLNSPVETVKHTEDDYDSNSGNVSKDDDIDAQLNKIHQELLQVDARNDVVDYPERDPSFRGVVVPMGQPNRNYQGMRNAQQYWGNQNTGGQRQGQGTYYNRGGRDQNNRQQYHQRDPQRQQYRPQYPKEPPNTQRQRYNPYRQNYPYPPPPQQAPPQPPPQPSPPQQYSQPFQQGLYPRQNQYMPRPGYNFPPNQMRPDLYQGGYPQGQVPPQFGRNPNEFPPFQQQVPRAGAGNPYQQRPPQPNPLPLSKSQSALNVKAPFVNDEDDIKKPQPTIRVPFTPPSLSAISEQRVPKLPPTVGPDHPQLPDMSQLKSSVVQHPEKFENLQDTALKSSEVSFVNPEPYPPLPPSSSPLLMSTKRRRGRPPSTAPPYTSPRPIDLVEQGKPFYAQMEFPKKVATVEQGEEDDLTSEEYQFYDPSVDISK